MIHDGSPNLPAVLARYERYGGLAVNWRMFGSAKHAFRPGGMVLGTFRQADGGKLKGARGEAFDAPTHTLTLCPLNTLTLCAPARPGVTEAGLPAWQPCLPACLP